MSIPKEKIISLFKETGALLEGHFLLTSGLHSGTYFQCAKVFQYPRHAETLCRHLADHFRSERIDTVVSPAVGGIVAGQETARLLGVRSIFTERAEGKMTLRRGFEVRPGERILVIEDVTTTGGSVKEVIAAMRDAGAEVIAVGAVVDRSGGNVRFDVPYHSLLRLEVAVYPPESCPLCALGTPAVKPGSRGLKSG
ncbi:MAG TPA: orotate phosphoribosyltransferase [bacterium]|nr:orotate phosphoribosyltransferase [bacterium]